MRQTLCDRCGEVIDPYNIASDSSIVVVKIHTSGDPEPSVVKEYHRRCAREETVRQVWQRSGLVDL